MEDTKKLSRTLLQAEKLVKNLLVVLSQKEKYVIQKRFNLDNTRKQTLEEIGQHFSVTRERIRQIEKSALTKLRRNVFNTDLTNIHEFIYAILENNGGIMREVQLINELLLVLKTNEDVNVNVVKLAVHLDERTICRSNTINFYPYVFLKGISESMLKRVSERGYNLLKKKGNILKNDTIVKRIQKALAKKADLSPEFILASLSVTKKIKILQKGVGLMEWRHINPKTLGDKILYILRESKKPLHFVEIANRIINAQFDKKRVNVQAVHNELIRNDRFVLIGRGIYALQEWGYKHGNVADVIEEILKGTEMLHQDEIAKEVLKRRQVKKITIMLSLKNKPQFERVGRFYYKFNGKTATA